MPTATHICIADYPLQADLQLGMFTPAERAVLAMLVEGRSNERIAWARNSSIGTVAKQIASVLQKSGMASRWELCRMFGGVALTEPPPALTQQRPVRPVEGHVLLVEDDSSARHALDELLQERGFTVSVASNLGQARAALANHMHDVLLLDVQLGDGSATELLQSTELPAVLLSGHAGFTEIAFGLSLGAHEYVSKLDGTAALLAALGDALSSGEPPRRTPLSQEEVSQATRITPADATRELLAGRLRCVLETRWQQCRRVVFERRSDAALRERTRAVARLMSRGQMMKEIHDGLAISEATAWLELRAFLDHAGLTDRLQLIRLTAAESK